MKNRISTTGFSPRNAIPTARPMMFASQRRIEYALAAEQLLSPWVTLKTPPPLHLAAPPRG
jgi:hypothetical protein